MPHERLAYTLVVIGLLLIVFAVLLAFDAYSEYAHSRYGTASPNAEQAIVELSGELAWIAAKVAFIALILWAGNMLLGRGLSLLGGKA